MGVGKGAGPEEGEKREGGVVGEGGGAGGEAGSEAIKTQADFNYFDSWGGPNT